MTYDPTALGAIPTYKPELTPLMFHQSDKFVRGIMGPVGSSKSSSCVNELLMRSFQQEPWKDGVRRTRHCIIRRTFSELLTTTIKTWQEWCPQAVCPLTFSPPPQGHMVVNLPDGTTVDMEVIFLALDDEAHVDKLRSLELTMCWFNEVKEIIKVHIDMATSRVRRYPSEKTGGPTFTGVIMDTNPPHDQHWYHELAEVECPENHEFFKQPPGVIEVPRKSDSEPMIYIPNDGTHGFPPAENIKNLTGGFLYYMDQLGGKSEEWIRVNLQGLYGRVMAGKPVYPEYRDEIHVGPKEGLKVYRGIPLVVGIDLGLHPSAAFCQMSPNGQLRIIDEVWVDDTGVRSFARDVLKPLITNKYAGMQITYVADPAGNQRGETEATTSLQVLAECGIHAEMASTNLFTPRREAVAYYLLQLRDGQPGFKIDPRCIRARQAFKGGYCYRMMRGSDGVNYSPRPDKYNKFTHISDAIQYAALLFKGGYVANSPNGELQGSVPHARLIEIVNPAGWT